MPAPKRREYGNALCTALGKVIRRTRRMRGIKASHLAELCGVREQSVIYWEHGKSPPSWESMTRLAVALQVPMWQLLKMAEMFIAADAAMKQDKERIETHGRNVEDLGSDA